MKLYSVDAEFLRGFTEAAECNPDCANDHWLNFARQLPDDERQTIETAGYERGLEEGRAFLAMYPHIEEEE